MTIRINKQQARKLGVETPARLDEIRSRQATIITESRSLLAKMDEDPISDGDIKKLERRHDELMAEWDKLERRAEMEGRTAVGAAPNVHLRPNPGDGEARGEDIERLRFWEIEPSEAFALRSNESFFSRVAKERREDEDNLSGLSVGAYLRSMVVGPKNEMEKRALAEGTDSAGGYTVPDILSARMIDRMRAASVVFRAGAQTVPLQSDVSYVAKVVSDPVPAWRAENAAVNESDPTFGRVTFTARSLAVLVKVSRELLDDSLNMETALPTLLSTALATELDRVALFGTGTAPQPRGVKNFAGLTANGYAGGALASYAPLITARTALRTVNSDVTAYIMSPRDDGKLAGLTATDGQPLMVPPAIADTPRLVTSAVPVNLGEDTDESVILAGDWSRLMIGIRSEIRVEILRERYADTLQYAFLAWLRADVAAEHEAAFTVLSGVTV